MKLRYLVVCGAVLAAAGLVYGATLQTAGVQEATKTGLGGLVTIVNANDVALNAELARAVTNATAQTATVSGSVTPQTATITVTITPQTFVPTFILADGTTNTTAFATNWTASFTGLTNVTVSVAGVVTNIALQRR